MSIANNTVNLSEIMTTASDGEGVLGKIVFYGLGGIMIDREEFERLRAACQFSAPTNFRSTPADAFRSATGDLHDRLVRGTQIYKVYCRDNRQRRHTISRELVLEEVLAMKGEEGLSEAEKHLGLPLPADCVKTVVADGITNYIGDLKSEDGIARIRIMCEMNMPHWPTPEMIRQMYAFFGHFSRDPKTKESIYHK